MKAQGSKSSQTHKQKQTPSHLLPFPSRLLTNKTQLPHLHSLPSLSITDRRRSRLTGGWR
ncbi:hypothetical protein HanIR_Chr15g0736811 [Helianthus annuus]|nr:hypothetical protein HanIR_Chr15g0736811 [Helianthus annuus]